MGILKLGWERVKCVGDNWYHSPIIAVSGSKVRELAQVNKGWGWVADTNAEDVRKD